MLIEFSKWQIFFSVHTTSVWTQASPDHCAPGNHPRVQEPLVLSVTVEVHRLLKPALISQSFDLPFGPFPNGIACTNAMQPARHESCQSVLFAFLQMQISGVIQVRCYSEATLTAASFSARFDLLIEMTFDLLLLHIQSSSVMWSKLLWSSSRHIHGRLIAPCCAPTQLLGKRCQVRDSHLHRCSLASQTLHVTHYSVEIALQ